MKRSLFFLIALNLVFTGVVSADTKTAIKIYNQALKETDDTKKIDLLSKALAQNPKTSKVKSAINNSLGLAYRRSGDLEKSKYHFTIALKHNPKNYYFLANRCSLYTLMNEYDNALTDCQQAIKYGPKRGYDYNTLASVYEKTGNYELAEKYYKTAIEKSPEKCYYHNNLGYLYYLEKDFDKSVESFDAALKLCKGYAKAYANRGNAFYKLEEYEEALKDYERASKLNPENAQYYKGRAHALISLGECGKSLEDISELLTRAPYQPDTYLTFALYWTCRGSNEKNDERALKYIKLAVNSGFEDFEKLDTDEPYKTFFTHIKTLPQYEEIITP